MLASGSSGPHGERRDHQNGPALRQQQGQPPMEPLRTPLPGVTAAADPLGGQDAGGEGQHGQQIVQRAAPVPLGQIDPHQDDVARLRRGKHLAPVQIAVRVQQPAGEGQQKPHRQGLRGLKLFHGTDLQKMLQVTE